MQCISPGSRLYIGFTPLVFFIILFTLVSMPLFSQDGESSQAVERGKSSSSFEQVVDHDLTIDSLVHYVRSGRSAQIPKDKYIMIEGVVASRQLLQAEKKNYFGILEISSGEWHNEDLLMYTCYFQLKGEEFAGAITKGHGQSPDEIPLHSHIIAIGKYLGYGEDKEGNKFPVLEAEKIRILNM